MTRNEISVLLSVIAVHDPYMVNDSIALQAWADALKSDITAEFARSFVAAHYGKPDAPRLTVGVLNAAWANRQPDYTLTALGQQAAVSVPAPSWFREQVAALANSKAVSQ